MERIRVFPVVVLAAVLVIGIIVYWVSRRKDPPNETVDPAPQREVAPPKPADQAPPSTHDPGQKILDGADGAFKAEMYPTALKFYKDFELRYAGTEVYDRNLTRLWERIHSSNASLPKDKQDPDLPAYLEGRRKLADEWKKLQPLTDAAEVDNFAKKLPPQDGRRKVIDAWRERK